MAYIGKCDNNWLSFKSSQKGTIMPFPIGLNGKLELAACYVTPDKLRDEIVSSLNSKEGCWVRNDDLTIFFTNYGWFRNEGWDLDGFSKGKFSLEATENSIVIWYQLSRLAGFLFTFVVSGLLCLYIVFTIRNVYTLSPIIPPIVFLLVFLLFLVSFTIDNIQKRKKIHRFLINSANVAATKDSGR